MPKTTIGPLLGYTITITVTRDTPPAAPANDAPASPDLLDQLLAGVPPHLVVRPHEQAIAGDPPMIAGGVEVSLAERLAHLPPEQQARVRAFLAGPADELVRVVDAFFASQADAPTAPRAKVRKYIGQP